MTNKIQTASHKNVICWCKWCRQREDKAKLNARKETLKEAKEKLEKKFYFPDQSRDWVKIYFEDWKRFWKELGEGK
jgi:hypothetical protein